MKTWQKVLLATGITGLIIGLLWYFMIYKGSATADKVNGSKNKPPYYTAKTLETIKSMGIAPYPSVISTVQWGEFSYQVHKVFQPGGDDSDVTYKGKNTYCIDNVIAWFKGMNISPLNYQNGGDLITFKDEITTYVQSAKCQPQWEVTIGQFLK